jgi:hypothetical protein
MRGDRYPLKLKRCPLADCGDCKAGRPESLHRSKLRPAAAQAKDSPPLRRNNGARSPG